jgi:hypothetical protein
MAPLGALDRIENRSAPGASMRAKVHNVEPTGCTCPSSKDHVLRTLFRSVAPSNIPTGASR